ncbi:hypothetical protein L1887_33968 [Cichorium endivia]|nr:hypothetical protein L1887_33968 [Cichorium endivia]
MPVNHGPKVVSSLHTVIDDFFDVGGSMDELVNFVRIMGLKYNSTNLVQYARALQAAKNLNHKLPISVISSIDSDIEISEVNDNSNQMETESNVRLESKIVMESIEFVIDNRYKASDCIDCSGKSITVAADPLNFAYGKNR